MNKELICICCPRGCHLSVDMNNNVTGNFCPRGVIYAKNEVTNPTRTLTSTVRMINSQENCLSVKTSSPIPKGDIFAVMNEINKIRLPPPIHIGDVIICNVLKLGVDIIATQEILK